MESSANGRLWTLQQEALVGEGGMLGCLRIDRQGKGQGCGGAGQAGWDRRTVVSRPNRWTWRDEQAELDRGRETEREGDRAWLSRDSPCRGRLAYLTCLSVCP